MSYFIFLQIQPHPNPLQEERELERVIELMVDKVLSKIIRHYLFPNTYNSILASLLVLISSTIASRTAIAVIFTISRTELSTSKI